MKLARYLCALLKLIRECLARLVSVMGEDVSASERSNAALTSTDSMPTLFVGLRAIGNLLPE